MAGGNSSYIPYLNIQRALTQLPGLLDNDLVWFHEMISREIDQRRIGDVRK